MTIIFFFQEYVVLQDASGAASPQLYRVLLQNVTSAQAHQPCNSIFPLSSIPALDQKTLASSCNQIRTPLSIPSQHVALPLQGAEHFAKARNINTKNKLLDHENDDSPIGPNSNNANNEKMQFISQHNFNDLKHVPLAIPDDELSSKAISYHSNSEMKYTCSPSIPSNKYVESSQNVVDNSNYKVLKPIEAHYQLSSTCQQLVSTPQTMLTNSASCDTTTATIASSSDPSSSKVKSSMPFLSGESRTCLVSQTTRLPAVFSPPSPVENDSQIPRMSVLEGSNELRTANDSALDTRLIASEVRQNL